MGYDALAPLHVFIDMGRRWTYLRPVTRKP